MCIYIYIDIAVQDFCDHHSDRSCSRGSCSWRLRSRRTMRGTPSARQFWPWHWPPTSEPAQHSSGSVLLRRLGCCSGAHFGLAEQGHIRNNGGFEMWELNLSLSALTAARKAFVKKGQAANWQGSRSRNSWLFGLGARSAQNSLSSGVLLKSYRSSSNASRCVPKFRGAGSSQKSGTEGLRLVRPENLETRCQRSWEEAEGLQRGHPP